MQCLSDNSNIIVLQNVLHHSLCWISNYRTRTPDVSFSLRNTHDNRLTALFNCVKLREFQTLAGIIERFVFSYEGLKTPPD